MNPPVSAPPTTPDPTPTPGREPGHEPSLENLLLRFGLVTLDQLAAAMREQTETGTPFSEVLVRDGILGAEALERVQQRAPEPPPAPPAPPVSLPVTPVFTPSVPVTPPAPPEPERLRVLTGYAVVGRLVNGDEIEIASVEDEADAERIARDAMRACSRPSGDWPILNGRYVRPESIVSIEVVERFD